MRAVRGFSLAEMLVAVGIVSIITALAVPAFNEFFRTNKVASHTNELVALLNYARSEALKRQANVIVSTTNNGNQWLFEARTQLDDQLLRQLSKTDADVKWTGAAPITFDLRGRSADAHCLQLDLNDDSKYRRHIDVLAGGRIRAALGACS